MIWSLTGWQVLFTVAPLTIAIIHAFLFAFEPRRRQNLYFALLAATLAGVAWFDFEDMKRDDDALLVDLAPALLIPALLLTIVTFVYAIFYDERPKRYRLLLAAIAVYAVILPIDLDTAETFGILIALAVVIEVLRVILVRYRKTTTELLLPALGVAVFGLFAAGDMLLDLGILKGAILGTTNPYLIGSTFMLLAMSLHLARDFARTGRRLEQELVRVTELSGQMLEQERSHREEEVRRRVAEAENARRGQELDEARALQLAMLPRELPTIPGFEIAAAMQTATEVGGDYYDFHQDDDGITIVIGDALGHGARAGTLVAATKSMFTVLAEERDPAVLLAKIDQALRGMELRRIHMALTALRLEGRTLRVSTAGMPPVLVRSGTAGDVVELLTPHSPLGSMAMPFSSSTHRIERDDLILLMTDGLPELPAGDDELGYDAVRRMLKAAGPVPPQTLIDSLLEEVAHHLDGGSPPDDITLIALRAT